MRNGKYAKKIKSRLPLWLTLIAVVLLVITLSLIPLVNRQEAPNETNDVVSNQTQANQPEKEGEDPTDSLPAQSGESSEQGSETTPPSEQDSETNPDEETEPSRETDPAPTVQIVQQADAEYEKWLSAAMVVCVSMEYPDFELEGIYISSSKSLEDKFTSDGAYIVFTSGGNRMAIHSIALAQERTTAGTRDISTEIIGFATFDQLDPANIDYNSLEIIDLEELEELIAQSLLVTIYTH